MVYMYRDLEGAVGNMLSTEAHTDDIFPRLGCRVEDIKRSVCILNNVHIHLSSIWSADCACNFALPSSLCVHGNDRLFSNLNGWTNSSSCGVTKCLVTCKKAGRCYDIREFSTHPLVTFNHALDANIWSIKATDGFGEVGSIFNLNLNKLVQLLSRLFFVVIKRIHCPVGLLPPFPDHYLTNANY